MPRSSRQPLRPSAKLLPQYRHRVRQAPKPLQPKPSPLQPRMRRPSPSRLRLHLSRTPLRPSLRRRLPRSERRHQLQSQSHRLLLGRRCHHRNLRIRQSQIRSHRSRSNPSSFMCRRRRSCRNDRSDHHKALGRRLWACPLLGGVVRTQSHHHGSHRRRHLGSELATAPMSAVCTIRLTALWQQAPPPKASSPAHVQRAPRLGPPGTPVLAPLAGHHRPLRSLPQQRSPSPSAMRPP
mmetsp:Transcript_140544/g.365685  ORF Transcript_140544/g.365685 Transcript_140544/m.365685 type:complete len:237 (-) Transcript_140544:1597-2307(-)